MSINQLHCGRGLSDPVTALDQSESLQQNLYFYTTHMLFIWPWPTVPLLLLWPTDDLFAPIDDVQ